jgi:hypothetical protein
MSQEKTITQQQPVLARSLAEISHRAASWTVGAASLSLFLILLLHFLKPELSPSWRMVSEYSIGNMGWVMKLAFFSWAVSCFALFRVIRSQVTSVAGKTGLVLLVIVGISLIMAGLFDMDPVTATKEELTTHGHLHGVAAMMGIPVLPVAAILITISLLRNGNWAPAHRPITYSAHFTWISFVLMMVIMFITLGKTEGKFSPEVVIGWPNRILILAYCLWIITVARQARKLKQVQQHSL